MHQATDMTPDAHEVLKGLPDEALRAAAVRAGASEGEAGTRESAVSVIISHLEKRLSQLTVAQLKERAVAWWVTLPKGKKSDLVRALLTFRAGVAGAAVEFLGLECHAPERKDMGLSEIGADIEETIEEVECADLMNAEEMTEVEALLTEQAKMSMTFHALEECATYAFTKLEQKEMEEGIESLIAALAQAKRTMADFESMALARAILAARETLSSCTTSFHNTCAMERMLHDTMRAYRDGLSNAKDHVLALLEETLKVHREELIGLTSILQTKQIFVSNLKAQGVDVFNAERFLRRAAESLDQRSCRDAAAYLEKVERSALESRKAWIIKVEESVPATEALVHEAEQFGADVSEAVKFLEQAKVALQGGDYSLCFELLKRTERMAIEAQQAHVQKMEELRRRQMGRAEEDLASAHQTLMEAMAYNVEGWRLLEEKVMQGRVALQRGDAFGAGTAAKEAKDAAQQLRHLVEESRARVAAMSTPLRECPNCHAVSARLLDTGYGRCLSCGYVFPYQYTYVEDMQRSGWTGIFGRQ